jgi:hypothetical protein
MSDKRQLPVIDAGHVANCGATDCNYNQARTCQAPNGVTIVFHSDHADCGTYTKNLHKA